MGLFKNEAHLRKKLIFELECAQEELLDYQHRAIESRFSLAHL